MPPIKPSLYICGLCRHAIDPADENNPTRPLTAEEVADLVYPDGSGWDGRKCSSWGCKSCEIRTARGDFVYEWPDLARLQQLDSEYVARWQKPTREYLSSRR